MRGARPRNSRVRAQISPWSEGKPGCARPFGSAQGKLADGMPHMSSYHAFVISPTARHA